MVIIRFPLLPASLDDSKFSAPHPVCCFFPEQGSSPASPFLWKESSALLSSARKSSSVPPTSPETEKIPDYSFHTPEWDWYVQ